MNIDENNKIKNYCFEVVSYSLGINNNRFNIFSHLTMSSYHKNKQKSVQNQFLRRFFSFWVCQAVQIRFALSVIMAQANVHKVHHFNIKIIISEMDNQIPENANAHCPGPASQEAGKQSACQGCPNQSQCASGAVKVNPAIEAIADKLRSIKHKILVLSGKGGVGKSTVATQLALLLSQKYEVGLLDVDICGPSVPTMLGLVGQEVHQSNAGWSPVFAGDLAVMSIGFLLGNQNDAVIWRGPRKNGLIQQFLQEVNWGDLDYLIIDTPPGTSDEHLSLVQFLKCTENDGAIVVTTPQEVALADVRKELSFCVKTGIPIIGVVQNMSGFVCPNCKCQADLFSPSSGGASKMCEEFKCPLICKIPLDPKIQALIDQGKSIFQEPIIESPVIERYQNIQKFITAKLPPQ